MIDIRLIRTNPELVKENIKKKFQDEKLVLVDEVIELDAQLRTAATEADTLRNQRNVSSKQIGALMAQGKKEEAEEAKRMVASIGPQEKPICRVRSAKECWLSQTSLTIRCRSAGTTAKMLRWNVLANLWFRILKFHIMWILWSGSAGWIWIAPEKQAATAFTI